jgi:hypothetical protein
MKTVVDIEDRGRGAPQYPVYAWRVNLHGATPIYCLTLKEAKQWAARYGGVTRWTREQDAHHVRYIPAPAQEGKTP